MGKARRIIIEAEAKADAARAATLAGVSKQLGADFAAAAKSWVAGESDCSFCVGSDAESAAECSGECKAGAYLFSALRSLSVSVSGHESKVGSVQIHEVLTVPPLSLGRLRCLRGR